MKSSEALKSEQEPTNNGYHGLIDEAKCSECKGHCCKQYDIVIPITKSDKVPGEFIETLGNLKIVKRINHQCGALSEEGCSLDERPLYCRMYPLEIFAIGEIHPRYFSYEIMSSGVYAFRMERCIGSKFNLKEETLKALDSLSKEDLETLIEFAREYRCVDPRELPAEFIRVDRLVKSSN